MAGQTAWYVPCTTMSGNLDSSSSVSLSRNAAASTLLMLCPCVARIRKCDGFVSFTATAVAVAFSCPALVVGTCDVGIELGSVSLAVVPVSPSVVVLLIAFAEGMCNSANRFLSDEATA